jgi:hypothetical protein
MKGEAGAARAVAERYWASPEADDWSSQIVAAVVGDRERANKYAARIDARPGGMLVRSNSMYVCACGAPFDLDATPNFRQKIEQAGFPWPPPAPIKYPAKTW